MRNIGQPGPNGYNTNSHGGNYPYNFGAFNPNPPVGYNPNSSIFSGVFNPNFSGGFNGYTPKKDTTEPIESEFLKFAEAYFKEKFSNVQNVTLAIKQLIVMVEETQTFLAQTIYLAVSIMENEDKHRAIFVYIWKSLKLHKLFRWLYVKFLNLLGCQVPVHQEVDTIDPKLNGQEVSYGLLAFLGVIISAPYFIFRLYELITEDPMDPVYWKHSGYPVKVIRDFFALAPDQMTVRINDKLIVAPKVIQSEMNLDDTEFVFATHNGRRGLVPVKHLAIEEPEETQTTVV